MDTTPKIKDLHYKKFPLNKIINQIMPSTLDYYGQYNPESTMDWDGFKSSKFGRTRKHFMPRDIIRSSLDMPLFQNKSGRKHYEQKNSPQKQFRSSLRKVQVQHWVPKFISKKIVQFQSTNPHPRREKRHLSPLNLTQDKTAGLRIFQNLDVKRNTLEYIIEDKMQRKQRVDQSELRRTFFQNESCSMMLKSN